MLERRRKEKQEQDAQKVLAIEQKIENARIRLEAQKKIKSQKAKNVVKARINGTSQQDHPNADLEDYGYEDMAPEPKPKRGNYKFRSNNQTKSKERMSLAISESNYVHRSMNMNSDSPARHEMTH